MRRRLGQLRQWYRADDTVMVTQPRRAWRKLAVHALCTMIVGTTALVVAQGNSWLSVFGSGFLGGLVAVSALGRHRQARAYWRGWLRGRSAMVSSLGEAGLRDMDLHEWISAEISRDLALIGAEGNEESGDDPRDC